MAHLWYTLESDRYYTSIAKSASDHREGDNIAHNIIKELNDDEDSGWQFFAGDEDDEYINNVEHVELCKVYSIAGIDPAVINHIDSPAGTRLIRKSSEEFEEDRIQPAFMEKWR